MSRPNKQSAYQLPVPCRKGLRWSCLLIVMVALSAVLPGCDDDDDTEADTTRRMAEDLSQELRAERLRRDRDLNRYEAELVVAKADRETAVFGWVSTAAAVFLMVLLLVRERRARRVLERLLRVILDRIRKSHGPPPSQTRQE